MLLTALLAATLCTDAAACELRAVAGPPDDSLAVPFPPPGGGARLLSRGSLVRTDVALSCGLDRVPAVVVAENGWYREAGASHAAQGELGCIDPRWLQPLAGVRLAPQPPLSGQAQGDRGPLRVSDGTCHGDRLATDQGPVPLDELGRYRPQDDDQAAAVAVVQAAWARHQPGPAPVAWSDWGRVSLPLVHERSPEELAATWLAEALDTPERREKAVVALGPEVHGVPLWAHFLGSDAPRSDRWGSPAAVAALVEAASTWRAACPASPERCTVQVGDLAFPSPRRPDPLGHKDHDGTCVDLRLFQSDGSQYEAWWSRPDDRPGFGSAYDAALTAAFLQHVLAGTTVALFNDPAVIAAVPGVRPARGHDDHLHICWAGAEPSPGPLDPAAAR